VGDDGGYFLIAVIIGGFLIALTLSVIVFLCGGRSDGDETNGDRPA
jgi:hypothetical protein